MGDFKRLCHFCAFFLDIIFEVGMIDELLRGLLGTSMETMDQFITHEVTNHLFEEKIKPFSGLDLAALNIQRGDYKLPLFTRKLKRTIVLLSWWQSTYKNTGSKNSKNSEY